MDRMEDDVKERVKLALSVSIFCIMTVACGPAPGQSTADPPTAGNDSLEGIASELVETGEDDQIPDSDFKAEVWKGDFDGMVERRTIRALVTTNPMMYFLDGATQRGASYDALKLFEEKINKEYKTGNLKIEIIFIPFPRERLFTALRDGWGDIASANLTITEERLEMVDFSDPSITGIKEIPITSKGKPELTSLEDLAGREIMVRKSSSYYQSLIRLNRELESRGLAPVEIIPGDEYLEDADLLEMVNADLIPMIIVDSHKAEFWNDVYDNLQLHEQASIRVSGEIGWAFRKDSPLLKEKINEFVAESKKGTLTGNIILKRYLKDNKWVRNATDDEDMERFNQTIDLFREYADEYKFDWLMVAAQGYQESRLDQSVVSKSGAIGVMQLLPSTANDKNVGIPDIHLIDKNIHAGTKYLRFLVDRYFSGGELDELNRHLFGFAAYNAGPARVAKLRAEAKESGLDPNVWFDNVEVIASKRIGRETVQYVSNIYKYYIAYRLILNKEIRRQQALKEAA